MPRSPNNLPHIPRTRQELYDQIRASSKDAVILAEMIRYGFWKAPDTSASPGTIQARIRVLEQKLADAQAQASNLSDIDTYLKAQRRERMEEARDQRAETKARRIQEAKDRAAAWQRRKALEIGYLGEGVSAPLQQHGGDPARLAAQGLPFFAAPPALAAALGLTLGELRFLAFHRAVSRTSHYRRFAIPKKTGGTRTISAPMPRLKAAQAWVQEHILARVPVDPAAHGFTVGRSILTNAAPHVGAPVVINADMKDFFPTITYPRVWGAFRALGYGPSVATVLALLCTEPDAETVVLDGQTWQVSRGPRILPQGAPTSPALTNLLCRRLDRRLSGLAAAMGLRYTRYADDLTFSGPADLPAGRLLGRVRSIVTDEGFTLHPDKTRIMRAGSHQEVTGIVVNEKPNVDRATLRRFRALLHQIRLDGPAGKRWGTGGGDLWSALYGYASFVRMVNPDRGAPLVEQVRALMAQYAP